MPQRRHSLPCRRYTHSRAPGSVACVVRRRPVYVTIRAIGTVLHIRFQKALSAFHDAIDVGTGQRTHQPERMHAARKQHFTLIDISRAPP